MIVFNFRYDPGLEEIAERLGSMSDKAKPVLKKSVNAVAKQARKMLVKEAQKKYAVKQASFNKGAKIQNATNRRLYAVIHYTGKPNELKGFRVNPATYRAGAERPEFYKAKAVKANSMKKLQRPRDGVKAFIVKFASGHTTVVQREGKERLPIKTLYSTSNPHMIGAKRVYGVLRPQIGDMLDAEVSKQIERQLRRGATR